MIMSDEVDFDLNEDYIPDIENLRESFNDIGIIDFRGYLDTHLTQFGRVHNKLDRKIDRKYDPSGRDDLIVESVTHYYTGSEMEKISLLHAYHWSKSNGNIIVVRDGTPAYKDKEDFHHRISISDSSRFEIVTPQEVVSEVGLSQ